jgi:hypothetical protein
MPDELYDESFHVTYPAWLLVHKSCVVLSDDGTAQFVGPPNWLTSDDDQGERAVLVFTDEHTALSYCEASGLVDEAEMIAQQDAVQLADVLDLLNRTGKATWVTFDPTKVGGRGVRGPSAMPHQKSEVGRPCK